MSDGQSEHLIAWAEDDRLSHKPVWLIVGPAQSGKDTLRVMLESELGIVGGSTSEWYCQRHWGLAWREQLWTAKQDPAMRKNLAAEMAAYNLEDGTGCRLYQQMYFSGRRLISGIRRFAELAAFTNWLLAHKIPVRIVWVVRMVPKDETLDFGPRELYRLHLDAGVRHGGDKLVCLPVPNTGTPEQLRDAAAKLARGYEPCNVAT